jgi:hypothetical protein
MNITEFLSQLRVHADKPLIFVLPDGGLIPAHFHITEVGHVTKRFIDCGGTRRTLETCLLQTWVHDDVDHRLVAGKLATIFDRAGDVLPLERGSGGRVLCAFSGMQGATYDAIRRDHYYVSIGERDRETVGLSVPVFGAQQALRGVQRGHGELAAHGYGAGH